MASAYNTIRQLDPFHLSVGAGFAGNKAQYTDSQIIGNGQRKLDTSPMLPSITCTKAQGAQPPKPCEARFPAACDRTKNPTGGGCCIDCGDLAPITPVTGLSLDIVVSSHNYTEITRCRIAAIIDIELHFLTRSLSLSLQMIENYSPSMDQHAKDDAGALRKGVCSPPHGDHCWPQYTVELDQALEFFEYQPACFSDFVMQVPWQPMVNCDGSYTLEERITPHKSPRVLQTLMWISTIVAGTPHQLIFAGEQPMPMAGVPWGGAGSHPERTFWGETPQMFNYQLESQMICLTTNWNL